MTEISNKDEITLNSIDKMDSTSSLMKFLHLSDIDESEFKTNMMAYTGEYLTYESSIKDVEADIEEMGGFEEYIKFFRINTDNLIKEHMKELMFFFGEADEGKIREYLSNPEEFIQCVKHVRAIEAIATSAPMISINGIYEVWRDSPEFNHGKKDLFVSHPDPHNPFDEGAPSSVIKIPGCTDEQFVAKLNYAKTKNPDGMSVMAVGQGKHWTLIAVDHKNKRYRFIDSFAEPIPAELASLIEKNLGDHTRYQPSYEIATDDLRRKIDGAKKEYDALFSKYKEEKKKMDEKDPDKARLIVNIRKKLKQDPQNRELKEELKLRKEELKSLLNEEDREVFEKLEKEKKQKNKEIKEFEADFERLSESIKQQRDGSSCGFWLIKNASAIAKNGLECELQHSSDLAQEKELIDKVRLSSYKTLAKKILQKMRISDQINEIKDTLAELRVDSRNASVPQLIQKKTISKTEGVLNPKVIS